MAYLHKNMSKMSYTGKSNVNTTLKKCQTPEGGTSLWGEVTLFTIWWCVNACPNSHKWEYAFQCPLGIYIHKNKEDKSITYRQHTMQYS